MTRPFNKVFGIGLSKTGTTSLARALGLLGVRTADYPHDPRTLEQLERGDFDLAILRDHDAITDTPAVPYYPQLDRVYPNSRFILTVRDRRQWLRSAEQHWAFRRTWASQNPAFRRFSYFICAAVYGVVGFDAERFGYVYDRHMREVRDYFKDRPGDLLVMDICAGQGWETLCPFLGLPQPAEPFPFLNRNEEKADRRRWAGELDALHASLAEWVPAGETIILLDEGQLSGARVHETWRCLPFTERAGQYWGPPADSDAAIAELRRLQREHGAGHLAVAWPARWWLDHYRGFADYLRQAPPLIENEQVTLFRLPRPGAGDGGAAAPAPPDRETAARLGQALALAPSIDLGDLGAQVSPARWTLSAEALRVLAALVRAFKPRHVLELGSGLSTRLLARTATQMKHRLAISSIDHDPAFGADAAERAAADAGEHVTIRGQIAPLVVRPFAGAPLPAYAINRDALAATTPADFALIDGPPAVLGGRGATLFQVMQLARTGALVLLDDADRDDEQRHLEMWRDWLGDAVVFHRHPQLPARLALIEIREPVPPDQLWAHRRTLAVRDIRRHVPAGSRLVLIDANHWERSRLADFQLVPFIERNGADQGAPADDRQAVAALDAAAAAGAYLVIPWSSSWWADVYPMFNRALHERHRCMHRGAHVAVFQLHAE